MAITDENGREIGEWEHGYAVRFDKDGYHMDIPVSAEVLETLIDRSPRKDDPDWLVLERRRRTLKGIKNKIDRL